MKITNFSLFWGLFNFNTKLYDGTEGKRNYSKRKGNSYALWETLDRNQLLIKSKDLYRNSPIARGVVNTLLNGTIGSGLMMNSTTNASPIGLSNKEILDISDLIERHWNVFEKKCDWRGFDDFGTIQRKIFLSVLLDGDCFYMFEKTPDENGVERLRVKVIEGEMVSTPLTTGNLNLNRVIDGVDYDNNLVPRGIIVNHVDQDPQYLNIFDRNGRRLIYHIGLPFRPNQFRGLPLISPAINMIESLHRFVDAELQGAIHSSSIAGMITDKGTNPTGGLGASNSILDDYEGTTSTDTTTNDVFKIQTEPGTITRIPESVDFHLLESKRPNKQFNDFFKSVLTQVCSSLDLPVEVVEKIYTNSYSASRAANMSAELAYARFRKMFVRGFCEPVYEKFLTKLNKDGAITLENFDKDDLIRNEWLKARWYCEKMGHIDPEKEAKASVLLAEKGLSTYAIESAKFHNKDFKDLEADFERERKHREEFLGIGEEVDITSLPGVENEEGNDE